jgi:hypothetical protein
MKQTIFPDLELLVVARLQAALNSNARPVTTGVRVSTKKPPATVTPYPLKIVTIRSDGASQVERGLMREESLGVNVFVNTANAYADANELAAIVEALLRNISGGPIKLVENILSPTRVSNPNEGGGSATLQTEEQRFMTFNVLLKANNFDPLGS